MTVSIPDCRAEDKVPSAKRAIITGTEKNTDMEKQHNTAQSKAVFVSLALQRWMIFVACFSKILFFFFSFTLLSCLRPIASSHLVQSTGQKTLPFSLASMSKQTRQVSIWEKESEYFFLLH